MAGKPWPLARGFWERVGPANEQGCREWQGSRTPDGYGTVRRRVMGIHPVYAHRVAWTITDGPIPKGMDVLHRCDNPPCCERVHLFLGTNAENTADMVAKGRGWWQKARA